MNLLNRFASAYFSLLLLLSCILGFFLPPFKTGVSFIILTSLFLIIFTSFYKVEVEPAGLKSGIITASVFVIIRFLVLPVGTYFLLAGFSSFFAFIVFFILLMPAAVSSPAFTSLFGTRINLSMLILMMSSFLSIVSITVLTPLFSGPGIHISMQKFLFTLLISILLPFLLHLPGRRSPSFSYLMKSNVPLVTVVALSLIFIVAISSNRSAMVENPAKMVEYFFLSMLIYAAMYGVGWWMGVGRSSEDKLTFSISSGMNNIGLAVSLATLYLSPSICIFMITAEFAWVGLLLPLRILWRRIAVK